jgi:hypothetical protein
MSRILSLAASAILVSTPLAAAASDEEPLTPFSSPHIPADDLTAYRALVEALPGIECEINWIAQQRDCDDTKSHSTWTFTLPGHPAHPAYSRARVVFFDRSVAIQRAGHYSGDEVEFQKWLAEFEQLDQRQMDDLGSPPGQ